MPNTFTAQIEDWVRKVEGASEAVFKEAAQDLVSDMQTPVGAGGNLPLETGFLRASLVGSTSQMPTMREGNKPQDGATYSYDGGQIALIIAGADPGDTLFFGYTAVYARRVHYNGSQWVTLAAQRWQQHVDAATARVKAEFGL